MLKENKKFFGTLLLILSKDNKENFMLERGDFYGYMLILLHVVIFSYHTIFYISVFIKINFEAVSSKNATNLETTVQL